MYKYIDADIERMTVDKTRRYCVIIVDFILIIFLFTQKVPTKSKLREIFSLFCSGRSVVIHRWYLKMKKLRAGAFILCLCKHYCSNHLSRQKGARVLYYIYIYHYHHVRLPFVLLSWVPNVLIVWNRNEFIDVESFSNALCNSIENVYCSSNTHTYMHTYIQADNKSLSLSKSSI